MLIKSVIAILAAIVIIDALIVYSCCVVAGRADDVAEQVWRDRDETRN